MEEYQIGDWSSGKKHNAELTLNVRPLTPSEHPIFLERIFSAEGKILSAQTEAQITTTDVAVTVTPTMPTVPTDADASTLDEISTTDEADNEFHNVTDIEGTWNGTTTKSRAVSSVVKDEVTKCIKVYSVLSDCEKFCSLKPLI